MKKGNHLIKKVLGGFILGTVLLLNFEGRIFAHNLKNGVTYSNIKDLPKPRYQNSMGSFSVDFTDLNVLKEEFTVGLNVYLDADQSNSFKLVREHSDEFGNSYYNYQHFYNNIKVEGNIIFVQVKKNKVQSVSGQFVNLSGFNTTVSVSDEKVKEIAYIDFGIKENVKEGLVEPIIIKQEKNEETISLRFAKRISLTSLLPMRSEDFYIDAQTGELFSSKNKIYKADTPSTSTTYYRGNQDITVDSYNGGFRLRDNARKIRTFNGSGLDGGINSSSGIFTGYQEYTNTTADFISVATKPAIDVHWGMSKTYDYYKNVHNRDSFDGNGHVINNYYDAGKLIGDSENAAAIDNDFGSVEYIGMVYGAGGSLMNPVVGLDVAGHEYSHLVIGRNGNGGLDYENESGALNESFADIFGSSIEFYVNLNPNWTIGENIIKGNSSSSHFRNMGDPNSGLTPQPDTYKGTYWKKTTSNPNNFNDHGGVHTNSGVSNYWFYLLSVGGYGTNDLGNKYGVLGIGVQKAEKIAYKALITGLTPTATFMDAYNATISAAIAIYGANSNEWEQVVNAWYAVGIGNAPAATQNLEMQGKLNIYPNPAAGDVVTIDSSLNEKTTFELFDLTGKQIMPAKNLEYSTTLNISTLATGMYILKFKSKLGEYSHKLMVK